LAERMRQKLMTLTAQCLQVKRQERAADSRGSCPGQSFKTFKAQHIRDRRSSRQTKQEADRCDEIILPGIAHVLSAGIQVCQPASPGTLPAPGVPWSHPGTDQGLFIENQRLEQWFLQGYTEGIQGQCSLNHWAIRHMQNHVKGLQSFSQGRWIVPVGGRLLQQNLAWIARRGLLAIDLEALRPGLTLVRDPDRGVSRSSLKGRVSQGQDSQTGADEQDTLRAKLLKGRGRTVTQ